MSVGSDDGMVINMGNPEQTWRKACSTDISSTINPTVIKCGQKPTIRSDRAVTDLNMGITSIYKPPIFDSQKTLMQCDVFTWNHTYEFNIEELQSRATEA
jgi:hypothetical protein